MTCIVGIQEKNVVWIGADSAGTNGRMDQRIRADKKVFVKGEFIVGFCGSFRAGQLLTCNLEVPPQPEDVDDFTFLVNEFTAAVRKCLAPLEKDDPDSMHPNFLFGYRGNLYGVEGDYQISRSEDKFDAVGSGADIAMGALHVSKGEPVKKRILRALEASAKNNAAVRPPFHVMSLKAGEGS